MSHNSPGPIDIAKPSGVEGALQTLFGVEHIGACVNPDWWWLRTWDLHGVDTLERRGTLPQELAEWVGEWYWAQAAGLEGLGWEGVVVVGDVGAVVAW